VARAARVGNDVVDLGDATTAGAHLRPRFVARVCSEDEQARMAVATDPAALLWSLFAAKEAAFKVVSKLSPGIAFAHRLFEVSEDLQAVRYGEVELRCHVWRDGDCIHAVAIHGDGDYLQEVQQVALDTNSSAAARKLLRESLAEHIGCAPSDLAVRRHPLPGSWTGSAPPELECGGVPTNRDISLSHDGRFVAFAAVQ
jgi:phosphopantetheinyl transferase (holo-ACP synthase)